MALRGVYGWLLSRGPSLRVLRSWSSAATQTGQCRTWGGMGREELEAWGLSRGDFPVLCLQKKAGRPKADQPSVRTSCRAVRLRPLSNCLSVPDGLCPGIRGLPRRGGRAAEAVSFPEKGHFVSPVCSPHLLGAKWGLRDGADDSWGGEGVVIDHDWALLYRGKKWKPSVEKGRVPWE